MATELGILVTTTTYFKHVIGLARAAHKAGIGLRIFFTGEATHLTQAPEFADITKLGRIKVCDVSYKSFNYDGLAPGLEQKDHTNQIEHALMVSQVDRYVVF
jgi:hypothetical protein